MTPLVACPNCYRDSTTLTHIHIEYDTATVTYWCCSGCAGAVEIALLQRHYDTYQMPTLTRSRR